MNHKIRQSLYEHRYKRKDLEYNNIFPILAHFFLVLSYLKIYLITNEILFYFIGNIYSFIFQAK